MNKKPLIIFSLLFLASCFSFIFFWPDGRLHFIACDVGQGDALLIIQGFNQVLIDGGPNDKVLGCLARHTPFWDRRLEMVVNTHPEADHLRGLIAVLSHYQVGQLISNSLYNDTDLFAQFHALVLKNKLKVYSPRQGDRLRIGKIDFEVLWPDTVKGDLALWQQPLPQKTMVLGQSTMKEKFNDSAVTLMLKFQNFTALLAADIPQKVERQILNYCQQVNCQRPISVLKVAHHGSKTSSSPEFLAYFKPQKAVISVGENHWGHPAQEVIDRLLGFGSEILRTDLQGDIEITAFKDQP
jgi:competence protein ComEC